MKQKALGMLVGFLLLSACGQVPATPALQNTSISTATFTPIPTETLTPTETHTPPPTPTLTPTETPGPYWQLGNFGEYIHAVNDNGQETFNFLAPFEQWPTVTDIKPSTIEAIHRAYESIILSDGTPLVKPMTGPGHDDIPPLIYQVTDSPYGKQLGIGNDNARDPSYPRTRYLGGIRYYFNGSEKSPFSANFLLVTMQVEDKSAPEGYSLWTGILLEQKLTGMLSGRIPALFNNTSQFNPYITFDPHASDSQYNDLVRFLQNEASFDPALYAQALLDFSNGKPNRYLYSHPVVTNIGATRWYTAPTATPNQ